MLCEVDRIIADHAGEGKTKDYHNDIKNAAKAKNWSLLLSEVCMVVVVVAAVMA